MPSEKAALRGEPSYIWRAGQERRLQMFRAAAPGLETARVLENGCGVGAYARALAGLAGSVVGMDIEEARVREAARRPADGKPARFTVGVGERLAFRSNAFDLVLSNEVLEHVQDDRAALREIVRVLRPGGRLALFCPNRGYPFETHGIYWRGTYRFGNFPLVNYLPDALRNRLAPHVRVYSGGDLNRLLRGLPVRVLHRTVVFGGYDNIIARFPRLGRLLRIVLQALERTPLRAFGLSHFWVIEKT
jgi:SAM-dependent methyltransferase